MLKVILITPAPRGSRGGNRATVKRWARLLGELGCQVQILGPEDTPAASAAKRAPDIVLALHAWRSHAAIQAWRQAQPNCPLVLVLTGTDVYQFQHSDPKIVRESLESADALIGLHDCLKEDLPERFHDRLHIMHQSALPLPANAPSPSLRNFEVLVVGHLPDEKDSLRAAYAVRDLPSASRLKVIQLGGAHTKDWAQAAREEMAANDRYQWLGDLPHWRVRQWMARARLMVISSRMEGGANVVSEACVASLPVIASDIPGNRGLLGEDYNGYYTVANAQALQQQLLRAEGDPAWLAKLKQQVQARAPLFRPEKEREALKRVLNACGVGL